MNIKIRGLDKVKQFISTLPRNVRGLATKEGAYYIVGNERQGLQYYPPRVEHGANNPYQWESDKQRRAYFATNGFGKGIPYNRSYDLRFGWQVLEDGANSRAVNNVPYAKFVQGDNQQKGHRSDRWRVVKDIIASNTTGMMRAINLAVERWLKSQG